MKYIYQFRVAEIVKFNMKTSIISITVVCLYGILPQITYCDDELRPTPDGSNHLPHSISSRNYGNGAAADSSNVYYNTYTGYPSYGSSSPGTFSDQFIPNDYPHYGLPDMKKKRPYSPTPPYYFDAPGNYGPSVDCNDQMMHTILGDVLGQNDGIAAPGLLKSFSAAIIAAFLAKIPIILAVKALIVKLFLVPFGIFVLGLPFILPIMLLFTPLWTRIKETFFGITTPAPTVMVMMAANETKPGNGKSMDTGDHFGRDVFVALVESDKCFEKLACLLGSRDAESTVIKPVSWLLKFLQTFRFVRNNAEIRTMLKRYREAYLHGAAKTINYQSNSVNETIVEQDVCSDQKYLCNMPTLYANPAFARFSRYL